MVYFLSDTHIGSGAISDPVGHQKRVVDFLLSLRHDASAIYLLGDIFDFWFEYCNALPEGYDELLKALSELTHSGVEVHFYVGNHDMWTFGYLEKEIGMHVHHHSEVVTINGKRCYLAHGHELYTNNHKFMALQRIFKSPVARWLFRNLMPPSLGQRLGNKWSKNSRMKELQHPHPYTTEDNEWLVRWAKRHEQTGHLDYYIFGHRHIELDLMLKTKARVIILGDGFRTFTYGKMDDEGNFMLDNY